MSNEIAVLNREEGIGCPRDQLSGLPITEGLLQNDRRSLGTHKHHHHVIMDSQYSEAYINSDNPIPSQFNGFILKVSN
jgi:hypothetical protein